MVAEHLIDQTIPTHCLGIGNWLVFLNRLHSPSIMGFMIFRTFAKSCRFPCLKQKMSVDDIESINDKSSERFGVFFIPNKGKD